MNTFEAIYERRAARVFDPGKKVPPATMEKILETACLAPCTPDGIWPWKLIVVRDADTKELIANCAEETARLIFGGSYEIFSEHMWYMPKDTRLRVAEYTVSGELWRYPIDADTVVIPVLSRGGWRGGLASLLPHREQLAPYLGFAAQNMWLAATTYGIGAGFNAMPMQDVRRREILHEFLGIPPSWESNGAFAFGYSPSARSGGPSRAPLEGVVFSGTWGSSYKKLAFTEGFANIKMPEVDLFQTMGSLNLVKSFVPGPIEPWKVERVIDSAIWGPTPENAKNWRFIIVKDQDSKEFLYRLVNERKHTPFYYNDAETQFARFWYLRPSERLAKIEEALEEGIGKWYLQADTLIIAVSALHNWLEMPHAEYTSAARNPNYPVATGCSVQNMMIAATALGLGVNFDPTPIGDPRDKETLCDYFCIPPSWQPIGVLSLGLPGAPLDQPPQPSLESVAFEEYWGNPYKRIEP